MIASVKIIHGPNDDFFDLPDGSTVLSVSHNLADAFNIPRHFAAFVNGERVHEGYHLQHEDTVEFVVPHGRKGAGSLDEFLSVVEKRLPLETWDEETTALKQNLFLDANSYHQTPLFDLPSAQVERLSDNFLVSPSGSFAYQNRVLPKGIPLALYGVHHGVVVFNGDVVIPTLIDMTMDSRSQSRFAASTAQVQRAEWGAVWMSLTPGEMLTQRPGIRRAHGTVLIGGLGLGWMLGKVCQRDSVDRVIVVEQSQELLDWYGHDLCKRFPKVSDVICDDVFNQIGMHGASTMHLLDIWRGYADSSRDRRLLKLRRQLKQLDWA